MINVGDIVFKRRNGGLMNNHPKTDSLGLVINKMFNFTTTVEEIDRENEALITAAGILESLGNYPGLSTDEFYDKLLTSELPEDLHESITLAAIAIEMMMTADKDFEFDTTVH